MSERYFTADTHFGHEKIIEYCERPFDSADEMDEAMVERFNEILRPEDTLIHLGDVLMGDVEKGLENVKRINGKKILISGNHDYTWTGTAPHKKDKYFDLYLEAGFVLMPEQVPTFIGDKLAIMSHFPYQEATSGKNRFKRFRPTDNGHFLLHGHIHDDWLFHDNRMLNVGVDVWDFRPVSVDEITPYVKKFEEVLDKIEEAA